MKKITLILLAGVFLNANSATYGNILAVNKVLNVNKLLNNKGMDEHHIMHVDTKIEEAAPEAIRELKSHKNLTNSILDGLGNPEEAKQKKKISDSGLTPEEAEQYKSAAEFRLQNKQNEKEQQTNDQIAMANCCKNYHKEGAHWDTPKNKCTFKYGRQKQKKSDACGSMRSCCSANGGTFSGDCSANSHSTCQM